MFDAKMRCVVEVELINTFTLGVAVCSR
jgi:hypothetical protein